MKKMQDIRALEKTKLHRELAEARAKVLKLRFGVLSRQVKNVRDIRSLRTEIARMLTVLNEHRRGQMKTKPRATKNV